jgi:hypothetical protein
MRDLTITAILIVIAAGMAGLAAWTEPDADIPTVLSDQGQPFFPGFKDVMACKALEIIAYDEATATAKPFKVEFRGRRWSLPSHFNYPADAQTRLTKTAAALMDLRKDTVRSDSTTDHPDLGVVDPLDTKVSSLAGRGKRVTFRDGEGKLLADFILGKTVEGKPGYRYIRIPGQKRTYAVKTEAEPSANFEDWIETDLLKLSAGDIRKVTVNSYSINEQMGTLDNMERTTLAKDKDKWKANGSGVKQAAVDALLSALDNLRIVNVAQKPTALTQDLKTAEGITMSMDSIMSLRQKGFFVTPTGQLLSNEGEIVVETDKGLVYTLRFGEIAPSQPGAVQTEPKAADSDATRTQERRYLFITVRYDEEKARLYNDGELAKIGDQGKRLARELTNRFADWYYVISGADFTKLRPKSKELVRG